MKVIVTGGKGQLGRSIKDVFDASGEKHSILFIDKEELDLTDTAQTESFFKGHQADLLINCAAYTAVDQAETDIECAERMNSHAVENLANAAAVNGFRIIHISTDYVFDGQSTKPYRETDTTNPQTVYGATKLKGEKILQYIDPQSIIIRTAWLYSPYGKNFYLTMKNRAEKGLPVNVVADQRGTPTNAHDLANAIFKIAENEKWEPGIFHFSNEGECTWYDFTIEIYRSLDADESLVSPISSDEYKCAAKRPQYSVLDKEKIKSTYKLKIPEWQESLRKMTENNNGFSERN